MSAISDLLKMPASTIEQKSFPAGSYKCRIVEAEPLRYYWGKSAQWGLMYVPRIRVVDVIPTGDPDLDDDQMAALERFGDWQGFSKRYTMRLEIPGFTNKIECGGIANGLNFPLVVTTPHWESLAGPHIQAPHFYISAEKAPTGVASGFVVDVLGLAPPVGADIESIIAMTNDKMLVVEFVLKQDNPDYPARLEVANTSAL
jgi:hypothetical protein